MPSSISISEAAQFCVRMLLGAVAVLACLEVLLQVAPVSTSTGTGYHFDPEIVTYPAHHTITMSTGWDLRNAGRYRSNNYGFLTSREFVRDPGAVAVIGDSYVEANMMPEPARLASQLEADLSRRPAYAFGGPGSSLLDYDERIRFAHDKFGIRDFVIVIERGDVKETLCGSGNIHSPCLDARRLELRHERMAEPDSIKKLLRRSALAQYMFSQLRIKPATLLTQLFPFMVRTRDGVAAKPVAGPEDVPTATVKTIVNRFIEGLPNTGSERYWLVFDSERDEIREGKTIRAPVRQQFMAMARSAGLGVIDTEPLFREHSRHSALSLDIGPYDKHWNSLANSIVAKALALHIPPAYTPPVGP